MQLASFPRFPLAHKPTPLEPMDRLREALGGGPRLWVKRDDCTGLATGGNKTRKLEFLIGDALARGARGIVTHGAVQSNHVRQSAAAAVKAGLRCEVLLEERVEGLGPLYEQNGNVLLDQLLGARVERRPAGLDMNAEVERVAAERSAEGTRTVAIPGGGSNPIGALGYVDATLELLRQGDERGVVFDAIVLASGSAGTHAGVLAGLALAHASTPVHGVSVRRSEAEQVPLVHALAAETAAKLAIAEGVPRERVIVHEGHVGPGYGQPTEEMLEALRLLARTEGLLFDPVYTGKALAGWLQLIREGAFGDEDDVVFLHTGGSAALFAYAEVLAGEAGGGA